MSNRLSVMKHFQTIKPLLDFGQAVHHQAGLEQPLVELVLLRASQILVTRLQEPLFILIICGAIYFIISFPVARLGGYLEKRWSPND